MSRALMILLALLLYVNLVFLQNKIDRLRQSAPRPENPLLIFPRPALVRALSLGHINLIADYYWLKTIQYLGTKILQESPPLQIWRYANFVTELSPGFFEAYYYPSVIMIVYRITPRENLALLEKGERYYPRSKDLALLLGFVNYYFARDNQKAAKYFEKAYQLSGYQPYALLATRLLAEKGNLEYGQAILGELANDTRNPAFQNSIREMMKGMEQRKHLDFLDQKIEEYQQKYSAPPETIQDLIQAQLLSPEQLPGDPLGGKYYIDPQTHRAKSTREYYLGVYKPKEFQE